MKKLGHIISCVFLITSCFLLMACSKQASDSQKVSDDQPAGKVVTAPTDFTFDAQSGAFTFSATDENAGYYFVRAYAVTNGAEASTYTVSSKRIQGGKTGTLSGTVDVSSFGWGNYNVKLVTFAAAGSGYTAPDPTVLSTSYGVGGILEKPELMALADGNEVELVIDWYSLTDWYVYQYLPSVVFNIYSDEACTSLVQTETVDLSTLTVSYHPTGGIMWGEDAAGEHKWINDQYASKYDSYKYTLEAGTYYITCQAISGDEAIAASSKVSDVVEFTLTSDAPTGAYTASKTSLWKDPEVMGVPLATAGLYTDRIDYGPTQTTTSKVN